ncbi:glycosyltransferase family 2 protein [Photobacterium damselae]
MNVIAIVNYNNAVITEDFIHRFNEVNRDNILLIVDNSQSKGECKRIEADNKSDNLIFLYPEENLGYMRAGALAYEHIRKKFDFDFFILCNNDVFIQDDDVFIKLDYYKNIDPDVMLLSPVIIDNNKNVNPYMIHRKSNKYMLFWSFILSSYLVAWFFHKVISMKKKSGMKSTVDNKREYNNVYGTHGSIFILNKSFFNNGGRLDELPFLYGEEIYISEQIRLLKGKCLYVDDLIFSHNSSSTLGKKYTYFKYKCISEAHAFLSNRYY